MITLLIIMILMGVLFLIGFILLDVLVVGGIGIFALIFVLPIIIPILVITGAI